MRIGDSGLLVDYIVQKLRDYYPKMESEADSVWTSTNSRYLAEYVNKYMPEMACMINRISMSRKLNKFFINTNGVVTNQENYINYYNPYVNSPSGDKSLGDSIPKSYPLVTYAVSLNYEVIKDSYGNYEYIDRDLNIYKKVLSRKYRLRINYKESSLSNPDLKLSDYIGYALVGGRSINEGQEISFNKLPVTYMNPTEIPNKYLYTFEGKIYSESTDPIGLTRFSVSTNNNSGFSFTYDSKTYSGIKSVDIKYQLASNSLELAWTMVNENDTQELPSEISASELRAQFSGAIMTIESEILNDKYSTNNLTIYEYVKRVNGVILDKSIYLEGITSKSVLVGNQLLVDSIEEISPGDYEVSDLTIKGIKYLPLNTDKIRYSVSKATQIESKDDDNPILITIPRTEVEILSSNTSSNETINEDVNGVTLLLQLPKDLLEVSLIELDLCEDNGCDYDDLNETSVVTTDYLDLILLDRTITKYSDPDDIEYVQDLSNGHYGDRLGVYDEVLKDYIKLIQSEKLSRTTYVTGWVDPETEYYLEIQNGVGVDSNEQS